MATCPVIASGYKSITSSVYLTMVTFTLPLKVDSSYIPRWSYFFPCVVIISPYMSSDPLIAFVASF